MDGKSIGAVVFHLIHHHFYICHHWYPLCRFLLLVLYESCIIRQLMRCFLLKVLLEIKIMRVVRNDYDYRSILSYCFLIAFFISYRSVFWVILPLLNLVNSSCQYLSFIIMILSSRCYFRIVVIFSFSSQSFHTKIIKVPIVWSLLSLTVKFGNLF